MEPDRWAGIVTAVTGLLAVLVTVVLAVRKATDREMVAYRRASESLQLLRSWEETDLSLGQEIDLKAIDDDVRARQAFRRDLINRASHFTQVYILSTKPLLTSYWQPVGFVVYGAWLIWWAFQSQDSWLYLLSAGIVLVIAWVMFVRVGQYKDDAKALRRASRRVALQDKREAARKKRPSPADATTVAVGIRDGVGEGQ